MPVGAEGTPAHARFVLSMGLGVEANQPMALHAHLDTDLIHLDDACIVDRLVHFLGLCGI